jgi:hypothetical protein
VKRNGQDSRSSAIRAALKAAGKPLDFATLHQAVEKRLQQVIGRARLRKHLSVIQATEGWLRGTGRGETRRYGLVEGGR